MKIIEIISEDLDEGKKKRKKIRWAVYGPGPFGLYGVNTGYSGDGGGDGGGVEENFADGKVKGKSRPGRVKRSGASCNGSVTSLRARAKAAGGEKAKMYHWCANMKSGRKKANEAYGVVPGDPIGDVIKQVQAKKQQPAPTQQPAPAKKPTAPAKKPTAPVQPQPITGTTLENVLRDIAIKAGILGNELAQFLAQCAHETANFTTLAEFGDSKTFARYDPRYNPDKAKQLGNIHPGDGERFKGRGYLQITGRYNYAQAGQALGLPLEQKPQMLEDPAIAAKASIWFWKNRVKPKVGNFSDTKTVTSVINPALRGLQQRHDIFKDYVGTTSIPSNFAVREEKDIRLIAKHYFPVDDEHIIVKYKMKKDRNGYYLPQWNTSGRVFDANFTSLNRLYGRPHTVK